MLAPEEGDVVLIKHRVSSFMGSGLDVVLWSLGITRLILQAYPPAQQCLEQQWLPPTWVFALEVLSDACSDARSDTHELLMEDGFPAMATVRSAEESAAAIRH